MGHLKEFDASIFLLKQEGIKRSNLQHCGCDSYNLDIRWDITSTTETWWFPEVSLGVPPVIIHFRLGFSHGKTIQTIYWGTPMDRAGTLLTDQSRGFQEEMSSLVYRVHAVPETVNDFLFDFGVSW